MELVEIGYFSKAHGVKGQLLLRPSCDFGPEQLKTVFIDLPSGRVPFFITKLNPVSGGLIVTLEDVTTVEQARLLVNKPVQADSSIVIPDENEDDLAGYALHDVSHGFIGSILRIEDHGSQQLFVVSQNGKEMLLPAADELIEEIDDDERKVIYRAPEGLIDLMRGE